jgi:hypothetical protein
LFKDTTGTRKDVDDEQLQREIEELFKDTTKTKEQELERELEEMFK